MGTSGMAVLISVLSVAIAYLIGAIPFGLLVARWAKGIDIRTVGSGNIGATNVGRVLGVKFFFLVFLLDMLKGLLPTFGLPWLLDRAGLPRWGELPVVLALATILGHNFPIYLRFKGGKGVATSFGALIALDPIAMLCTGIAWVIFLLVTRYVSLSSILAGFVFVGVHFVLHPDPWKGGNVAMTLLTFGLLGLLIARHHKNLGRIAAGTEPKVSLRKKKEPPASGPAPSGRVATLAVLALAVLAAAAALAVRVTSRPMLDCGRYTLTASARLHTGHQRAERVAFADGGRLLAVTCPRYDRIVLANTARDRLEPVCEIALGGRPVAVWPARDRLYVLERPIADARHVEAGWCEAFDLSGRPVGSRLRVGFDPDDLVISRDGATAFVLLSGRAEGETNRPLPELVVLDLAAGLEQSRVIGRLTFDQPGDDPERLALAGDERTAAVSLWGSNCVALVDLADPAKPRITRRTALPDQPGPLLVRDDHEVIVTTAGAPGLWVLDQGDARPRPLPLSGPAADLVALDAEGRELACTLPQGSALEVMDVATGRSQGVLPLRGRANLGGTRPLGLAYAPERGLLAVANRQGGSVHLVTVTAAANPSAAQREVVSVAAGSRRR